MARRSGGTHKGVEEKRRSLPIYQHYTLSPGKTKSHHPEAKCNHCLKEFVCGSKQRLIRHLRKCNSISGSDQIIADTLNTLMRNSATGQLNHSILEASNLSPSQVSQHLLLHSSHNQPVTSHHSSTTNTTANNNSNNITSNSTINNHNTSGSSCNELIAGSSNGSNFLPDGQTSTPKRGAKRGRKPANQSFNNATGASGIHVVTSSDGKTHFAPASQLPNAGNLVSTAQVQPVGQTNYYHHSAATSTTAPNAAPHLQQNSGPLACATTNHHHASPFKLNSETIDKAYLKLVLTRNLPLSLCDTREFQVWVKTFANDYKPPSSINLVAQNLKNEAQAARQRISNVLIKAPKKTINLELHTWPDDMREHKWYAVVATIDHKRFLISIRDIQATPLDQFNQIDLENNSPEEKALADFIDDCIKRVGSDRINSLKFVGRVEDDPLATLARQFLYSTHPSIVTYYCWWHFTNSLCSDIVEHNEVFQTVMRNSNRLINFVIQRPRISQKLEKFRPFSGVTGSIRPKQSDRRWYSHLVCYLLEYIRNNHEAIVGALEAFPTPSTQSHLSSDNNNNNSSSPTTENDNQTITTNVSHNIDSSTQQEQALILHDDAYLSEIKSLVMSTDYWNNLNCILTYLKPIHDIVALTSIVTPTPPNTSTNNNNNASLTNEDSAAKQSTPSISQTTVTNMSLSDYMNWFLNYGKVLIDNWNETPDLSKFHLIGSYLGKFSDCVQDFKLLIAAYLLNPKYRCAYMTEKAKNDAIVQILEIASEFMPEESDGHTICDQWQLYLVREEPYDMVFDEARQSPVDWWISLLCPESIRRVALRILRLKAFTTPKPDTLFSQLYFYEDETRTVLDRTSFEDVAVLRYFYDYEDKIGQPTAHGGSHGAHVALNATNGHHDRGQVGYQHNNTLNQANQPSKILPSGPLAKSDPNGQGDDRLSVGNDERFSDAFSDVVVDSYLNHHHPHMNIDAASNPTLRDLPFYEFFTSYVDYNETGVRIVEEPIERKRRKWTAQEILSKRPSNNNNNGADNSSK